MQVIALTGGIGSGKSTVADLFSALGVPVIDADALSRQLVVPGSECLKKIVDYFGKEYLDKSGRLKRRKLRTRIFTFPEDRLWLEKLLHPEIYRMMKAKLAEINAPYVICVIPLLVETEKPDFIDKIIVVDTDEISQIMRITSRDQLTHIQAKTILKSQSSREMRAKLADEVIYNNSDLAELKIQVNKLHACFCH
jgi:dephospho-CoA kinase